MIRNIFAKLTGSRTVGFSSDSIKIQCSDELDMDFLASEIEEFCYKRDIIPSLTYEVNNLLIVSYVKA